MQRLRRLHSDEQGQVLWFFVMTIMSLVILAAVVVNTGRQIARKIEMQNAADAAAVSSAIWIARGMNVISMDNVGMTEALGLIANLRAMHIAWQVNEALLSAEAVIAEALIDGIFTAPAGIALMVTVYAGWIPTCIAQVADVQDCSLFDGPLFPPVGFPVPPSPPGNGVFDGAWDGSPPGLADPTDGILWKFMDILADVNSGMQYVSPTLAFAEAVNVGVQNIHGNDFRVAIMLPSFGNGLTNSSTDTSAQQITGGYGLPVEATNFSDLCGPTQNGTLSPNPNSPVNTNGYVPLQYLNFFSQTYPKQNYGPFQLYQDDFTSFWWPSFFTGIPAIYRVLAGNEMSMFCGGDPAPLPPVTTRVAPLSTAQSTPGASGFVWSHWTAMSVPGRPPDCDSTCFTPTSQTTSGIAQTVNGLQAGSCAPTDVTCQQNAAQGAQGSLQGMQNAQAGPLTFSNPNVASSTTPNLITEPDSTFPFYPYPGTCPPEPGNGWCRLSGTDTFEQITWQPSDQCAPLPNPPPQPAPPPCQVLQDERYVFQYATVTQSVASLKNGSQALAGGLGGSGDASSYPQPMHITLSPGTGYNLKDHVADLPPAGSTASGAIQRFQYLVVAYRRTTTNPWLSGATVSPLSSNSAPVFGNSTSGPGLLTYAQSQVYNPTSWDLYTQNWHAKLVPASMLEREVGSFGSAALNNVFTVAAPLAKGLNAH